MIRRIHIVPLGNFVSHICERSKKVGKEAEGGPRTDVGVAKHKPLVQFILHPIHLAPNDAEERLAVDENFDPVLFDRFVECAGFLHVF